MSNSVLDKIDLRIAPAVETLDHLISEGFAETFDFVFIDADKSAYQTYFDKSFQLVKQGGLIAIDNVFLHGEVLEADSNKSRVNVMRTLNQFLVEDERIDLSMLSIADGLSLARKR